MRLFMILLVSALAQNCLNQNGKAVDWWVILMMPKDNAALLTGMEYLYCDSTNNCISMEWMDGKLDEISTPLERTVAQIDFQSTTVMSVLWSDQPSGKSSISDRAHSKGILSVSNKSGFVINHSTPQYPVMDETQTYIVGGFPDSAHNNAQHFMCISVTTQSAELMAQQYVIAQTLTNKANVVESFKTQFPNLYSLKDNSRTVPADHGATTIQTLGGLTIQVISTNMKYQVDFYEEVVAPQINVGLVMQTWGSGAGGLQAPICSPFVTYSSLYREHHGYKFKYTKDHSKFGISLQRSLPYVCMADINRMTTQDKRGGTALCFQNYNLWNIINMAFVETQTC